MFRTHPTLMNVLAIVVISGSVFVWLIDFLVELDVVPAIRIKWSLFWYVARYAASFSAVLLSLDILLNKE